MKSRAACHSVLRKAHLLDPVEHPPDAVAVPITLLFCFLGRTSGSA